MAESNPQIDILQSIVHQLGDTSQVKTELSDLLGRKKDGLYRRLKGETILSADEWFNIISHYQLDPDKLLAGKNDQYVFTFNNKTAYISKPEQYLQGIAGHLQGFMAGDNPEVLYASEEIPIFNYLFFPKILAFKFFIYGRTTWQFEELKDRKFTFDIFSEDFLELARQVGAGYVKVNSRELWRLNIVNNTLNQLEFIAETEQFDDLKEALEICDDLSLLVQHMKNMARKGKKFIPGTNPGPENGDFTLFFNEFAATNNTIITKNNQGQALYTTLRHPNFLKSTDPVLCKEIENWLVELMNHSTCISTSGGRRRNWYFNRLESKIELTKKFIQDLIDA